MVRLRIPIAWKKNNKDRHCNSCPHDQLASWAIHLGGPKILDAVERALKLPEGATQISRDVLRKNGNMSSPTVLFVLDQIRRNKQRGPVVALACGFRSCAFG
jgi:predicted naringenin-chalcone synthase